MIFRFIKCSWNETNKWTKRITNDTKRIKKKIHAFRHFLTKAHKFHSAMNFAMKCYFIVSNGIWYNRISSAKSFDLFFYNQNADCLNTLNCLGFFFLYSFVVSTRPIVLFSGNRTRILNFNVVNKRIWQLNPNQTCKQIHLGYEWKLSTISWHNVEQVEFFFLSNEDNLLK